jgi:hypothetical protein
MRFLDIETTVEDGGSISKDIINMSPPIAVTGVTFLGVALSDWVYIGTIVYTIVGIITMIKKYWVDPYLAARRVRINEEQRNIRQRVARQRELAELDSGQHAREHAE